MLLSVIVPVYNMAADDRLSACMDSLCAQTLDKSQYEIIAVDDCSSDNSLAILKTYAARHPSLVRVMQTPRNLRQGGAKNLGLTRARGEWIGFVDADDRVAKDFYERLLNAANEAGADMAGCDYALVDDRDEQNARQVKNNLPEQTGGLNEEKYRSLILEPGSLVVKIYKRRVIFGDDESAPVFPEGIFYEDNAVSNTLMLRATRFAYIEAPLYFYYQYETSTVHTVDLARLGDRAEAAEIMLERARSQGYLETYRAEIMYQFTRLYYINTLFSAMQSRPHVKGGYGFCKALMRRMKEVFPDFQDNAYYKEKATPEERRLIALQARSHFLFYLYYRMLWLYRGLRYGKRS